MAKLEGIIYKAFENFIVFRGYAPIGELAEVSKRPDAYQRMPDEKHKRDIVKFLKKKEYSYFPELVLAYRGAKLNDLIAELHGKDDVEFDAEKYVTGLKVLKERVPATGYRARHAQLTVGKDALLRVDGNHRLEPFSDSDDWWAHLIEVKAPKEYNSEQKNAWLKKQIQDYKSDVKDIIVPFSIVISNTDIADKFEASIFNNINFKQLPLKQEKNIHNIYKYLKDTNELGSAHELTMKLIELTENSHFLGLHLFERGTVNEIYRTVCFKTVELLFEQQEELSKPEDDADEKQLDELDRNIQTIRIDQKASSELFNISEEISKAIEHSSLLIADLSSHNINVYHEIGIAMGLAQAKGILPKIILLYKTDTVFLDKNKDDIDHFVGFNIRDKSQLRFQTYKQLVDGLVERLEKHYEV